MPVVLIALGFSDKIRLFVEKRVKLKSYFISRILGWIADVGRFFYAYRHYKKTMSVTFVLSIVFQIVRVLICYLLAFSIGLRVPIGYFFIITPLVMLFTMLPLSVGGIGVREGATIFFLGKIGISSAMALSVSLMCFIVAILGSLPGLYFYLRDGIGAVQKGERLNLP